MDWGLVMLVLFGSLVVLMATGLPVAFSFLLVNFVAMYLIMGSAAPHQLVYSIFESVGQFNLTPLPLFILMGEVMFHSGMAKRVLDALDSLLGRLPGRLSVLTIISGAIFAGLSGSVIANTALLGNLLLPDMLERRYNPRLSVGSIMASGSLAMLMPHSSLTILFATIAMIPVGTLLVSATVPGLLVAGLYIAYTVIICLLFPHLAPRSDSLDTETNLTAKLVLFSRDIVPILVIIVLTVAVIFYGVATPTEAAALGALCAVILAICYRTLSFKVVKASASNTLYLSSMILLIVAGSTGFSQMLAYTTATRGMLQAVLSLNLSPTMIVVSMMIIVFFLAMFMEEMSIIMITVPIFTPVITAMHINPIWYGVLMLMMLEKGLITPPAGMLLYVVKGIAPKEISMWDVWMSTIPYVVIILTAIVLVVAYPNIALYLANKMH
ncbi:MAG TPA: TRAP transporter large permease subunit [Spirochaetia bacterium]|nr:TRAP transporter large permease subunit [Spirochaetia bacterium]